MNMTSEHTGSHAHAISRTGNEFKIEFNEIPAKKIKHVSNIFVRCSHFIGFFLAHFLHKSRDYVRYFFHTKFGYCHRHENKWKIHWKCFRRWKNLLFLSMIFSIQVFWNWKPFSMHLNRKKPKQLNFCIALDDLIFVYFSKNKPFIPSNLIDCDWVLGIFDAKSTLFSVIVSFGLSIEQFSGIISWNN